MRGKARGAGGTLVAWPAAMKPALTAPGIARYNAFFPLSKQL
ncbi:hypothetical protein JOD97_002806 [Duganella sp. 1411]|nr:hypothetical protein [Duganella sp. 1411]